MKQMLQESHSVSGDVVAFTIQKTMHQIKQKQFVEANMNVFSSCRMVACVNEVGHQELINAQKNINIFEECQPEKLADDRMMTNTKVEYREQQFFQEVRPQQRNSIRTVFKVKSSLSTEKGTSAQIDKKRTQTGFRTQQSALQKIIKLKCEKVQTDPDQFDKQIVQQRKYKQEAEKQRIQMEIAKSNHTKYMKKKRNGLNYDYQGNFIQVKKESKKNIITKFLDSKINPFQNTNENPLMKKQSVFITTQKVQEPEQKNNRKIKKVQRKSEPRKFEDIEFSNISDPFKNIDVSLGIKATFGDKIVQSQADKLAIKSLNLKQSLHNRKISRNDFIKHKNRTNNSQTCQQKRVQEKRPDKEQQNLFTQVKKNQQHFDNNKSSERRAITQMSQCKISKDFNNLKIWAQQQDIAQFQMSNPQCSEVKHDLDLISKQFLSRIDRYNLDYSRNLKHYQKSQKIMYSQDFLPRAHSKTQSAFKPREKQREPSHRYKPKFQQSLRT